MRNIMKFAAVLASILAIVAGGRIEHFHHITQGLLLVSFGIIAVSLLTGASTITRSPSA